MVPARAFGALLATAWPNEWDSRNEQLAMGVYYRRHSRTIPVAVAAFSLVQGFLKKAEMPTEEERSSLLQAGWKQRF